jgi:hypothetical protein
MAHAVDVTGKATLARNAAGQFTAYSGAVAGFTLVWLCQKVRPVVIYIPLGMFAQLTVKFGGVVNPTGTAGNKERG